LGMKKLESYAGKWTTIFTKEIRRVSRRKDEKGVGRARVSFRLQECSAYSLEGGGGFDEEAALGGKI